MTRESTQDVKTWTKPEILERASIMNAQYRKTTRILEGVLTVDGGDCCCRAGELVKAFRPVTGVYLS